MNVVMHIFMAVVGYLWPVDRAYLERYWDSTNPQQVERAFCATAKAGFVRQEGLEDNMLIVKIKPGSVVMASSKEVPGLPTSAYRIAPICPDNDSTIMIHIHTPTTCDDENGKNCRMGGDDAWECFPTNHDLIWTAHRKLAIGGIFCDIHAIVFYAPLTRKPPSDSKDSSNHDPKKTVNFKGKPTRQKAQAGHGAALQR